MTSKVNLAVIYYSSNGTNFQLAQWAAEGGLQAGAEVKILRVPETAPQSVVDGNPSWKAHLEATKRNERNRRSKWSNESRRSRYS